MAILVVAGIFLATIIWFGVHTWKIDHGITDVYLRMDDALPQYDTFFTWEKCQPDVHQDQDERVLYIVDGQPVGHGDEGFARVVEHITRLGIGCRVLMYPMYDFIDVNEDALPPRNYPFVNYARAFNKALRDRRATLIHSPRDCHGRIHPHCREAFELWRTSTAPASQRGR